MPRIAIPDGLTQTATVTPRGADGQPLGPASAVTYRPALADAVIRFDTDYYAAPGDRKADLLLAHLAAHLVTWDVTDDKDRPVPLTRDNLARVGVPYLLAYRDQVNAHAMMLADLGKG